MEYLEVKKRLKNKIVLITGAAGFIGSHLTKRMVELGANVNIFVKNDTNLWRLGDVVHKVTVWEINLTDQKISKNVNSIRPDIVFHLGAMRKVERDLKLINQHIDINLKGTLNLLQAIAGIKIEKFINTGTCEEYGNSHVPFSEDQKEAPVSPYSATKTALTHFCQMMYRSMALPIVTLRPFLTYGPAQDTDMFIPSLIKHCLEKKDFPMTAGDQTREFNYVTDIVEAYVSAAIAGDLSGEIINIGNGVECKVHDVAKKIIFMTGNPIKLKINALPKRPGEAKHFYCSNRKAKMLLGWTPKIGLDEGLRRTIDWYKNRYEGEANIKK